MSNTWAQRLHTGGPVPVAKWLCTGGMLANEMWHGNTYNYHHYYSLCSFYYYDNTSGVDITMFRRVKCKSKACLSTERAEIKSVSI